MSLETIEKIYDSQKGVFINDFSGKGKLYVTFVPQDDSDTIAFEGTPDESLAFLDSIISPNANKNYSHKKEIS